jgi:hypothetical protein
MELHTSCQMADRGQLAPRSAGGCTGCGAGRTALDAAGLCGECRVDAGLSPAGALIEFKGPREIPAEVREGQLRAYEALSGLKTTELA